MNYIKENWRELLCIFLVGGLILGFIYSWKFSNYALFERLNIDDNHLTIAHNAIYQDEQAIKAIEYANEKRDADIRALNYEVEILTALQKESK